MVNETDFHRPLEAHFPWNFAVNVIDILFIMFSMSLISRATVMPLLVTRLTPSKKAECTTSCPMSSGCRRTA